MSRPTLALLPVLALLLACGGDAPPRPAASKRQVDSAIGASSLPGAQGVRGALRASDTAASRAAALDSASR
ncbi:MAG TPA: hypothetical protein VNA89_10205 [Gemmatimonadaceae bacterium]|nr:hypothetical protein [Gemmatimonadaceae bacterium]